VKVAVNVDERFWLLVPDAFPTDLDAGPRQWQARVLQQMRETWGEDWREEHDEAVPLALQRALVAVDPADTLTFVFWPDRTIANVVVHLQAARRAPGEGFLPLQAHAGVGSAIDVFSTDHLGDGLAVQYHQNVPGADLSVGGAYFLFQSDSGALMVWSEPTLLPILARLIGPLTALVDTLRLDLGEAGPWIPARLDQAEVEALAGEQWPVLSPDPT
jgi:hypothetical protein